MNCSDLLDARSHSARFWVTAVLASAPLLLAGPSPVRAAVDCAEQVGKPRRHAVIVPARIASHTTGPNEPRWKLEQILAAVRQVESGGCPSHGTRAIGDGGRALGPFQIHRAYWQDSRIPGRFEDCFDATYARRVVLSYWRRHCPEALNALDAQVLSRVHNGGPTGFRKESTAAYWCKVERELTKPSESRRGTR